MASNNGADSTSQENVTHFKIQPRRVNSDDCLIYPDREIKDGKVVTTGTGVAVHQGEWVEIFPLQSMRELILMGHIAAASIGEEVEKGEISEKAQAEIIARTGKAGDAMEELCKVLAERVTGWNWTDNSSHPLPQPYQRPDILAALSNDELMYLLQAARGETPDERKKDSVLLAHT